MHYFENLVDRGDLELSEVGESRADSVFENDIIWMTLDMASNDEYGLLFLLK